jgi:hypothetical protein
MSGVACTESTLRSNIYGAALKRCLLVITLSRGVCPSDRWQVTSDLTLLIVRTVRPFDSGTT